MIHFSMLQGLICSISLSIGHHEILQNQAGYSNYISGVCSHVGTDIIMAA